MNKNLSVFIAVALMLGVAVFVAVAQRTTDADNVVALAHQIADFELPAGYQADYAIELLGYTVAAYRSGDSHLTLLQAPPDVIPDEQSIRSYGTNENAVTTWRDENLVSTSERVVREHAAQMTIMDRTNGEGQRYRSLNLVFHGQNGTALLVINQPLAQWDEAAIEAFIASIH